MHSLRKATHHLRRESTSPSEDSGVALPGISDNAAFNTDALPDNIKHDTRPKTQRVKEKLESVTQAIAHPRQTAKQRATRQITATERPWLDDQAGADEHLFDVHDKLDEARLDPAFNGEIEEAKERVEGVENDREELQVAWHMRRYVQRARVIRRPVAFPPRERYQQYDEHLRHTGFNWIRYIGHLLIYGFQDASLHYVEPTNDVPYDRDVLIRRIERLLVASEAFQLWWMRVRQVYTWENPWLTFKWLMLFLVLLKTGYLMTGYWVYLLYSVASNYDGKHGRYWMRQSHTRAKDTHDRASMLSELMLRHGSDDWLEPLMDELGPWIQLQIGDLAEFLEVCSSYYCWTNPASTRNTCVTYAALIAISAVPSLEHSIKVFWVSCGLFFFLSRPIASNYPRFRHIVDPMRWMYWDAPNLSENAFSYLRKQALLSLDKPPTPLDLDDHPDTDDAIDDHDEDTFFDAPSSPGQARPTTDSQHSADAVVMHFPARWSGQKGRLELSRSTVRFASSSSDSDKPHILWQHPYADILELRKLEVPRSKITKLVPANKVPVAALSILWAQQGEPSLMTTEEVPNSSIDGKSREGVEEDVMYNMTEDKRNEAFNSLIGVSGALFMELQPEAGWQMRVH